ncbi:transposase domain-containing protein [Streptomyces griseoviridis]|uniref:transposase domain-containing protein n=1 Tax=Streptomyces griseoviridis TaxID=45398 RepID=UPI0034527117
MEGWGPGCRSRIGILTKVFTPELVDAAVAKHGWSELRRRLLPAGEVPGPRSALPDRASL